MHTTIEQLYDAARALQERKRAVFSRMLRYQESGLLLHAQAAQCAWAGLHQEFSAVLLAWREAEACA